MIELISAIYIIQKGAMIRIVMLEKIDVKALNIPLAPNGQDEILEVKSAIGVCIICEYLFAFEFKRKFFLLIKSINFTLK